MRRRGFLYRLPALLGLGVSAPQALAGLEDHVESQRTPLAGVLNREGEGEAPRPSLVEGAPVPAPARPERRVELQRSPVAGFQYHEGEAVWLLLAEGSSVDLVREPENTYDGRAVRVDWQGHKLGYLPRVENAAVSHLLDGGERLAARIAALHQSSNPWQRVEVAVELMV